MMKKLLISSGGMAVALIAVVVVFWPAPAISQEAILFNHGNSSGCDFISFFGSSYSGPLTIVQSGSGQVNVQCNASLYDGPAPDSNRLAESDWAGSNSPGSVLS